MRMQYFCLRPRLQANSLSMDSVRALSRRQFSPCPPLCLLLYSASKCLMRSNDKVLFLSRRPLACLLLLNFRFFQRASRLKKDIVCAVKALSCLVDRSLTLCRIDIALCSGSRHARPIHGDQSASHGSR